MSRQYLEYTVQPGDTLGRIASRFNVSVNTIFQASAFRSGNPNIIHVGEIAKIPQNPEDPTESTIPDEVITELPELQDEVSIVVGSTIFTGWTGTEISRAIDTAASGFAISGPFDPSRPELADAFVPYTYPQVAIYIGKQLVITGRVEVVTPGIEASNRTISIQGRSLPGPLMDCNIDADGWEFSGLTLKNLATQLCNPFSIPVRLSGPDTDPIPELRSEPGQVYFDFLKSVADANGRLITDDERGRLVIKQETASGEPVASIVEGSSGVMSIQGTYDGTSRFSKYIKMSQYAGMPDIYGIASDPGVLTYRPFVSVGSTAEIKNIEQAAEWERSLALSRSIQFNAVVSGWRNESGIWEPGQIVTVHAPSAYIRRETKMVIAQTKLQISTSGRIAQLRLVLPETYSGGLPESYPWEA